MFGQYHKVENRILGLQLWSTLLTKKVSKMLCFAKKFVRETPRNQYHSEDDWLILIFKDNLIISFVKALCQVEIKNGAEIILIPVTMNYTRVYLRDIAMS